MEKRREPDMAEAVAGALDWWREAGVDADFHDEPHAWIAPPAETAVANNPPAPESETIDNAETVELAAFDRTSLPGNLDDFRRWWLNEPRLDNGRTGRRVPPRGNGAARLMIVVPEPEAADQDVLLSGQEGRLLTAMLSSMGLSENEAYLASAIPRPMPGADWRELAARGFGEVLIHHVSLVRPERLIVFGANVLPLIGNDPPQGPADLRKFNHGVATVPMIAARSLTAMLKQPRWKAKIWQAWLAWTA